MKNIKDKNGIIPKEGDIIIGLYEQGKEEGVVIKNELGALAVMDIDGDILELESALSGGTIKQSNDAKN